MTFDGSAIDGFSRVQEADVLARPDSNTFQLIPWHGHDEPVARVFCDIFNLDQTPFEGCPRHALRRTIDRARAAGYTFFASPEVEYFYFSETDVDPTHPPKPIDSGSYFDLIAADLTSDLRKRTILTLEEMGIPVEYAQHEDAPSQHEIDLRYTDALTMADTVMTVRLVVKEIARKARASTQLHAQTPRRSAGVGDAHPPVIVAGRAQRVQRPRRRLRAVASGQTLHGRATAPCAGDHRRHQPVGQLLQAARPRLRGADPHQLGPQQPQRARPGARREERQDRVDPGRVPRPRLGLQPLPRLRGRVGGWAARHREGLRAPARGRGQPVQPLPEDELAAKAIGSLPISLNDAVDEMGSSKLLLDTLGDHIVEWFLRNKRAEWSAYRAEVTPFELKRYLPVLPRW